MKFPRFSPYLPAAVLTLGLACSPVLVHAQDDPAKRRAAAEELLKVRKTDEVVNGSAARMSDATDRIIDGAAKQAGETGDKHELRDKMRVEARKMIQDNYSWDLLRPAYVQAYSEAYTEAELKAMTAFYQSPAGQKMIAKEPEVASQLFRATQDKTKMVMSRVVQHLRELAEAANPGGPSVLKPPTLPPGMMTPPPPPPSMMVPPPPPAGMAPNAPPAAAPAMPTPPEAAPAASPSVHPSGKTEGGGQ